MGLGSADLVHVMVEAKKLAFADRERWGSRPAHLRSRRSTSCCRPSIAPGSPRASTCAAPRRPVPIADAAGDTTYFCTADGEGNAVSGIQSINSGWGSGVMAGDTGILLNNRMAYWHLDPATRTTCAPAAACATR